jgi:hypothetical protein
VCGHWLLPVPGQQLFEPMRRVIGDAGKNVGEPGLRIDVVHFCGDDVAIHFRRPLPTAVGTGEQPRLPAKCNASERALVPRDNQHENARQSA